MRRRMILDANNSNSDHYNSNVNKNIDKNPTNTIIESEDGSAADSKKVKKYNQGKVKVDN